MKFPTCKQTWSKILGYLLSFMILVSCDALYEGEGDCSYRYGVRFIYDWNIKFADAFSHEVKAVTLYVFNEAGIFVSRYEASGPFAKESGYVLPVDLTPGTYDLVAWCTWDKSDDVETLPFDIPELIPGQSTLAELTATLKREHSAKNTTIVGKDIDPLFHGFEQRVTFSDEPGEHIVSVPLMKNTNSIRVVLQHLSGKPVDADKFRFSITSTNGKMNYENELLPDETLRYDAWYVSHGSAGMETPEGTVTIHTAVAELTTARLMKEDAPRLTVTNERGETVISIPLVDYLLMVKGYYGRTMGDQEYLDRQDEYSLTFFLDQNSIWDDTRIIINSWAVVIHNGTVGGEGWE